MEARPEETQTLTAFAQDFRSENGLYSLIQAQFDAFAREAARKQSETSEAESDADDGSERQGKRRRVSVDDEESDLENVKDEDEADASELPENDDTLRDKTPSAPPRFQTPKPKRLAAAIAHFMSSPLSSPLADELLVPPSSFRFNHPQFLSLNGITSPRSSPPPEFSDAPDSSPTRHRGSSDSDTDDVEPPSSQPLFMASQTSNGGKTTLPNMKGKDLFDASIWADPLRTSVFYTFATSLRQKIKDAEPTSSHKFISHLRDRGKLVRCYTQNIDQIEEKVGLSTELSGGPGSRGRFSRRSTANTSQLSKMVEEAAALDAASAESSQQSSSEDTTLSPTDDDDTGAKKLAPAVVRKEPPKSGVECVFLHGSLELLRCFLCGKVCSWDVDDREASTLHGEQPDCPHCAGAAAERQERGKRALGVGKLRPDIVLYGEDHPNAHLISPIITHDLSLYPDLMLIMGTSLRVHGLKVMVREFAKTVHSRGGNVVFVNFTKPPESIWGDIIDYWVQWDCDAWVADLQDRVPKLWQEPEVKQPRQPKKVKPPPANPMALRDTRVTGAYCTFKVLKELRRISGEKPKPGARRASTSSVSTDTETSSDVKDSEAESEKSVKPQQPEQDDSLTASASASTTSTEKAQPAKKPRKPRSRAPRKSAPGALELGGQTLPKPSTLNPNHGRSKKTDIAAVLQQELPPSSPLSDNSILASVKANPRRRKRKMIDGEEVATPSVGRRRGGSVPQQSFLDQAYQLPPLRPSGLPFPSGRPQPLEPSSPPTGPLTSLSVNLRSPLGGNTRCASEAATWTGSVLPALHPARMGNENEPVGVVARGSKQQQQRTTKSRSTSGLTAWGSSWDCSPRV